MATEKDETEKPDKGSSNREAKKDIFSRAQFSFVSLSRFVVKIPSRDADKEFEFVLTRTGLDWKLTEAIIPLDKII